MTRPSEPDDVFDGVVNAFGDWLYQHSMSVGELVEGAAEKAFNAWLTAHSAELIEAIAERAARDRKAGGSSV